jgi:transcriptional regulator of acetoin/glycerol metabolism
MFMLRVLEVTKDAETNTRANNFLKDCVLLAYKWKEHYDYPSPARWIVCDLLKKSDETNFAAVENGCVVSNSKSLGISRSSLYRICKHFKPPKNDTSSTWQGLG